MPGITPSADLKAIHYLITADGRKAQDVFREIGREATRSFVNVEQEARRAFRATTAEARKAQEAAAGGGGGGLTATGLGKIVAGGGVLAVVSILARKIAEGAEEADKLVAAFEKGEISVGEMTAGIVKQIPIVGNVANAFESILLTVTGIRRELAAANEMAGKLEKQRLGIVGAQSDVRGALGSARNATALLGLEGSAKIREQARQEWAARTAEVDKLEKESKAAGLFKGNQKADIEELRRHYGRIYQQALIEAEDEDTKARQKQYEDIVKKDSEAAKKAADQRKARIENITAGMQRIGDETLEGMIGRRDTFKEGMMKSPSVRTGATAGAITSAGLADVLASRERRSNDPGVQIAKRQEDELKKMNKQIEEFRKSLKNLPAIELMLQQVFP